MLDWRWDFTWDILPRLLVATGNTIIAVILGYLLAVVLGLLILLLQRTPSRIVALVVSEMVEFIRSTPLVLQIFFVFYVGPQFGVRLAPWTAGMIAIGVHYACYLSEVYRGGLESVPKGQWEAATSLNMSVPRAYLRVIIPQALPASLPGMGNYFVGIIKDTPVLSVIGVVELMHVANTIGAETYRFLEPYTLVGMIFLCLSLSAAYLVRILETWFRKKLGLI